MHVLLITYDLRAPDRDYRTLFGMITSLGEAVRIAESVWALATNADPVTIRDMLSRAMDANDVLFVVQIDPKSWGSTNVPSAACNWLKKW